MKRFAIIPLFAAVLQSSITAQNDADALRYARTFYSGTARFNAMGGAFGTLGADFSTASTNPAGLGLYSMSEITVTPAFYIGRTSSEYYPVTGIDTRFNFNLSNAGFVIA